MPTSPVQGGQEAGEGPQSNSGRGLLMSFVDLMKLLNVIADSFESYVENSALEIREALLTQEGPQSYYNSFL